MLRAQRINNNDIVRLERLMEDLRQEEEKKATQYDDKNMARWIQTNLWIKPKRGGLERFVLNRFQRTLLAKIVSCFRRKKPVRLVILKSRQLGISTLIEAVLFYLLNRHPNTSGLVLANRNDSALNVFAMTRRFYRNLSSDLRKPLESGRPSKDRIAWEAPHCSELWVFTAGGEEIGRSWTLNYVHCSEMAFFPYPETTLTGLNQAVPKPSETWQTLYVIESTANGLNMFKTYWDIAKDPKSDWEPIFFTWRDDPTCCIEIPEGMVFVKDKEEEEYATKHNLTDGQILWARKVRENQCHRSWPKFHQEYPVTEDLAFISTGYSVFALDKVSAQLELARELDPLLSGDIKFLSKTEPYPEVIEGGSRSLTIWEHPDPKFEYVLGCDTSEGIGADYSEIVVMKKDPAMVVAHFRDNYIKPQDFGIKCWLLGAYYYFGLLGVERNAIGQVVLGVVEHGHGDRHKYPQLKRYPNLYYETVIEKRVIEAGERLGFTTSQKSKNTAIARLSEIVNDGDLTIYSIPLLLQMQGFVWDPLTKKHLQETKDPVSELYNDDGIMALAITNEMRIYAYGQGFCPKPIRDDW